MTLGDVVPGVLTKGWRFVTSDATDITTRIQKEFGDDTRLVYNTNADVLGVVHWFRREHAGKADITDLAGVDVQADGGLWLLAIRGFDPVTNQPLSGEPDERILLLARAMDTRRRDPVTARKWVQWGETMARQRETAQERDLHDSLEEPAALAFHAWLKSRGMKYSHSYFPNTIPSRGA